MVSNDPSQNDQTAETRPLYLEDWLTSLPYANPDAVSRELYQALSRLNRTTTKPANRFTLLELYAEPYNYLLESRSIGHSALSIGAFERNRAAVEATRKIAVELAFGYQLTVTECRENKGLLGPGKHLGPALQRTVAYLTHVLMHSYHEYLPTPKNVWKELNKLHVQARRAGLENTRIRSDELPQDFSASVDTIYKRILLTSLVEPYTLNYGQVWEAYNTIGAWAEHAIIYDELPDGATTGLFAIETDADSRPQALSKAGEVQPGRERLYLDTNPLLQRLQGRIGELKKFIEENYDTTSNAIHRADLDLLRRIARAWGLPPKRHAPRRAGGPGRIRLASGISAIHYFLSGRRLAQLGGDPDPAQESFFDTPDDLALEVGHRKGVYELEDWILLNEGPSGIGVLMPRRPDQLIRVGEVVGLVRSAGDAAPEQWTVGVIRWLLVRQTGEYLVGIQFLGAGPRPVQLRDNASGGGHTALEFAAGGAYSETTLIAPSGTFQRGNGLMLEADGASRAIDLGTLLESTTVYDQFSFS